MQARAALLAQGHGRQEGMVKGLKFPMPVM